MCPGVITFVCLQIWDALFNKTKNRFGFLFEPCLQQPASEGYIRLKSANPFEYPAIDPQYLKEQRDVDILLEGTNYEFAKKSQIFPTSFFFA